MPTAAAITITIPRTGINAKNAEQRYATMKMTYIVHNLVQLAERVGSTVDVTNAWVLNSK